MRRSLFIAVAAVLTLSACNEKTPEIKTIVNNNPIYSVLGVCFDTERLDVMIDSINASLGDSGMPLSVEYDTNSVMVTGFSSAFEAGAAGFNMHRDSLIGDYSVYSGGSAVTDLFRNFTFVGKYLDDRPALYNYDLLNGEYRLVWSKWGKKIMDINFNPARDRCFIKTVLGWGSKGGFPFIVDARIYHYDKKTGGIKEIEKLGKGMQALSYWVDSSTFKVSFNYLDTLRSSEILSRTILYDEDGGRLSDSITTYDLVEDGFPAIEIPEPPYFSPLRGYRYLEDTQEGITNIYLLDLKDKSRNYLTSTDYRVRKIDWSGDDKYLFIAADNTEDFYAGKSDELNSLLFIADCRSKMVIRVFDGRGQKNFVVNGPFLIFDEGVDDNSYISLFDYVKDIPYGEIRIEGGCGVRSLPTEFK